MLGFLLTFGLLSAAAVPALPHLKAVYALGLTAVGGFSSDQPALAEGSLSFRPFFFVLFLVLATFAAGPRRDRIRLLAFSWAAYAAGIVVLDVAFVRSAHLGAPSPFSTSGGLAAGIFGVVVLVLAIFTQYRLPQGVRVSPRRHRSRMHMVTLGVAVGGGLALTTAVLAATERLGSVFSIPLSGGLESKAVLFLLAVMFVLYLVSVRQRQSYAGERTPSIAFLVPAYNEAEGIAECIEALDAAAVNYAGHCKLYLVDNDSSDRTGEVAARAIACCRGMEGEVLVCRARGKSRALNFGLQRMNEELVVRVDADTLVSPSLLRQLVPYFGDDSVGGVSGLSVPKNPHSWLGRMRMMEVCYTVAFVRSAQAALDAVMVMPGVLSSYRRQLLVDLGGFGEGFNGEDADITVRIGRVGYRIVTDPRIVVSTEMPATVFHLREQRQRWTRGLFHMAARNISMTWMRPGIRGLGLLPWSILNASRRLLTIPILTCALIVEAVDPAVFSLREVSVLAGFVVSIQLVVIAALLAAHRHFGAILYVPTYLIFRFFRAYVALETLLTLQVRTAQDERRPAVRDWLFKGAEEVARAPVAASARARG